MAQPEGVGKGDARTLGVAQLLEAALKLDR
jgi:hypothetical protein